MAHHLGCDEQTMHNAIPPFNQRGLDWGKPGPSRPHALHATFTGEQALLHQSPRTFDKPTIVRTLELAAQVSFQQG